MSKSTGVVYSSCHNTVDKFYAIGCNRLILYPTCAHFSWREMVWWSLFFNSGKDQWDCKIGNYLVALPLQQFFFISTPVTIPFLSWFSVNCFLGYVVAKLCASPKNLTWFTRPFLLVRGWGLGTRLVTGMNREVPNLTRTGKFSCTSTYANTAGFLQLHCKQTIFLIH